MQIRFQLTWGRSSTPNALGQVETFYGVHIDTPTSKKGFFVGFSWGNLGI